MNDKLTAVVIKIRALRRLTKENNLITKRTQRLILEALPEEDLAIVAVELLKDTY